LTSESSHSHHGNRDLRVAMETQRQYACLACSSLPPVWDTEGHSPFLQVPASAAGSPRHCHRCQLKHLRENRSKRSVRHLGLPWHVPEVLFCCRQGSLKEEPPGLGSPEPEVTLSISVFHHPGAASSSACLSTSPQLLEFPGFSCVGPQQSLSSNYCSTLF
jgi:hypothetical protein